MEVIKCDSWEDFGVRLKEFGKLQNNWKTKSSLPVSDLLFRGQANHEWELTTTLERFFPDPIPLSKYYRIISSSKNEIEKVANRSWKIPPYQEYEKWLEKQNGLFEDGQFLGYDYMTYLRHYGFPSPLLDWTLSSDIAAFFAFYKITTKSEYVAIFAFMEEVGEGKMVETWGPNIRCLDKDVKTGRHSLQQSRYTICTHSKKDGTHGIFYVKHDEVVARGNNNQDLLKKYIIPSKEKIKILKQLEKYNINTFSLFNSEEGLLDTIATREFFLKE